MSNFIQPMMAKPMSEDFIPVSGLWVAEEKLDGHRIVIEVSDEPGDLFGGRLIVGWSRNGIERILPSHIREVLEKFPSGIYDGELLVPGERSFGTATIEYSPRLVYVVFDLLKIVGKDLTNLASYKERRLFLEEIFRHQQNKSVTLAWCSHPIASIDQVKQLAKNVWGKDGEGLILKRIDSLYHPGKRPKHTWLKIKKLQSAVLTIVAFREGKMGPSSIFVLEDAQGNKTTCKWKNLVELAKIEAAPMSFIGKKVVIEFQERTNDGSYRHPRFDRWAEEDD